MRKRQEVSAAKAVGAFATARCYSASLGYSSIKPLHLPERIAVVLWLPEASSSKPAASLAIPEEGLAKTLPAVHRVLMSAAASSPGAVFLLDCTPLVPAGGSARDIMDKEVAEAGADGRLGKLVSKPVSKILDKLLAGYRGSVTLVGVAGGAPLALCLLEQHGTKLIERIVMVKPYISPSTVNALLVKPSLAPPALDVLYESDRDRQRRDQAVRHAYPKGSSLVLDSHVAVGRALYSSILSEPASGSEPPPAAFQAVAIDPGEIDDAGRAVWWNEWTFELNAQTKQPEAVVSELDPWGASTTAAAPPGETASSCDRHDCDGCPAVNPTGGSGESQWAGALLLRGNRCVLVRSLASPPAWSGMRLPRLSMRPHEPPIECAIRAAAEACDIEEHIDTELERMPAVPPAALQLEAGRALIFPLYATRPPPEGPLEDADVTDEEDTYDW